jgi:hypothetical protein
MHIAIGEAPPVLRSNVALLASAETWCAPPAPLLAKKSPHLAELPMPHRFVMFFTPLRHLYNFFPVKVRVVCVVCVSCVSCVFSSIPMRRCRPNPPPCLHTRQMVLVALQAICWQRCVCFGVDLGISRFPNSFVTPVLLAIFAGTHHAHAPPHTPHTDALAVRSYQDRPVAC